MERRRGRTGGLTGRQMLGWANYVTYGRIAIVPVLVGFLYWINPAKDLSWFKPTGFNVFLSWFCALLFVATALTDLVDGYLARRGHGGGSSVFGKFIDPLADKLLSTAVFIMLVELGWLGAWVAILLIARDIVITAIRAMAMGEGLVIAASDWGKKKTALQSCAITALLIHYPFWGLNPVATGRVLIWLTLIVSIGSAIHYIWVFFRAVLVKARTSA